MINIDALEASLAHSNYRIKALKLESDQDKVQKLCEACSDYHLMIEGSPPTSETAKDLFIDVPPGKNSADKTIIGVLNNLDQLIGIIDMVQDYPQKGIWFIGLFMLIPEKRNHGLGEFIYKHFIEIAQNKGAHKIRLGVLKENYKALKFWKRMGFKVIKQIDNYEAGNRITSVFSMEHCLF